jgi:hypothetical protein
MVLWSSLDYALFQNKGQDHDQYHYHCGRWREINLETINEQD